MGWGGNKEKAVEARLDKLERQMGELSMAFQGARANFLMTVNQMQKMKEYVETHIHTMIDDHGAGTSRPQSDVINIIHEMVQVLEMEANNVKVDQNGMREAQVDLGVRLSELEAGVRALCARLGAAVVVPQLKEK